MRNQAGLSRSAIRTPQSKGFTLIETIITLVVLSIAAVGVLSVFTTGIRGSANPLVIDQATHLAQEKLDTIFADRMNPDRGFEYIIPANYGSENPVAPDFPDFGRSVTIICVDSGALNTDNLASAPCTTSGHTRVTVTVTNALIGSVSIDSLVTNY